MKAKVVLIVVATLLSVPGRGPAFLEAQEVWACGGVLVGGGSTSGHISYGYRGREYMGHGQMDHGYWPQGHADHGHSDYDHHYEYGNPYEEQYPDESPLERNWEGGHSH